MEKILKGFTLKQPGKIQYLSCDAIEQTGLFTQGFTLRTGGFSKKPYDSLNVGLHTEDIKRAIVKNIQLVKSELSAGYIAAAHQVHGDGVAVIRKIKTQADRKFDIDNIEADSIVTNITGVAASVRVADCVGTVIADPGHRVIASVHSGWRGIANKIAVKTVEIMRKEFGSDPAKLIAAISPAIGPCCYAVGPDVYGLKKQEVFSNIFTKHKGKTFMNLWKGAENLLLSAGLKKKNIHVCEMCTSCNPRLFFSHRRDAGKTGRMMVFGIINA